MNNKILILGLLFIIIVIVTVLLLKSKNCPTDKPYKENGVCVASCSSGKPYLDNSVCVASCVSGKRHENKCLSSTENCPVDKSYIENGVCVASCVSGKRHENKCLSSTENCPDTKPYLDNGVCVASCSSGKRDENKCLSSTENCPTTKPYLDNGVCVYSCPFDKLNNNGICTDCNVTCPIDKPYLQNCVCYGFFGGGTMTGKYFDINLKSSDISEGLKLDQNIGKKIRFWYNDKNEPVGFGIQNDWVFPSSFVMSEINSENNNVTVDFSNSAVTMNNYIINNNQYIIHLWFANSNPEGIPYNNPMEAVKWIINNKPQNITMIYAIYSFTGNNYSFITQKIHKFEAYVNF